MSIEITCPKCLGSGIEPGTESDPCLECDGNGKIAPPDWYMETTARIELLAGKLDSIIAEQASQREDLTAVLTQIWNKVKDL